MYVMVLLTDQTDEDRRLGHRLGRQATEENDTWGTLLSVRVRDLAWLRQRREIESFFVQELDRDRLTLYERG
jgi:hypothetical protein